jgi:hypothetical protein
MWVRAQEKSLERLQEEKEESTAGNVTFRLGRVLLGGAEISTTGVVSGPGRPAGGEGRGRLQIEEILGYMHKQEKLEIERETKERET